MSGFKRQGHAYHAVYRYLTTLIDAVPPGHSVRLPSLRELATQLQVSVSTVKRAYVLLEDEGRVQAVVKSGFFAVAPARRLLLPGQDDLLERLHQLSRRPGSLVLCHDEASVGISLDASLLLLERDLMRNEPVAPQAAIDPCGEAELRAALAARHTSSPHRFWSADDVFIGSDVRAVLQLLVTALELVGSTVVVATPCCWSMLRLFQLAGVRTREVPLLADGGLDIDRLQRVLATERVRMAVLPARVNGIHGQPVSRASHLSVSRLLAYHGVWILENDLDSCDLHSPKAGTALRDVADPQQLLVLGSLERAVGSEAPYGYLMSRKLHAVLQRHFLARAFRVPPLRQRAVARLIGKGRVDDHLQVRQAQLASRSDWLVRTLRDRVGERLAFDTPLAGSSIWAQVATGVDVRTLFERLALRGMLIAPGEVFSLQGHYRDRVQVAWPVGGQDAALRGVSILAETLG